MSTSNSNSVGKYALNTVEDLATGLASWIGADELIDDFISILHGYSTRELKQMILENKLLDNSIVAKLQALGTLTDRQISKLQGMLPVSLTSPHLIKAAQNVQKKIDSANALRDDITESLVGASLAAEQSSSDSYERTKLRRTQTGQGAVSGDAYVNRHDKGKEIENYEKRLSEI